MLPRLHCRAGTWVRADQAAEAAREVGPLRLPPDCELLRQRVATGGGSPLLLNGAVTFLERLERLASVDERILAGVAARAWLAQLGLPDTEDPAAGPPSPEPLSDVRQRLAALRHCSVTRAYAELVGAPREGPLVALGLGLGLAENKTLAAVAQGAPKAKPASYDAQGMMEGSFLAPEGHGGAAHMALGFGAEAAVGARRADLREAAILVDAQRDASGGAVNWGALREPPPAPSSCEVPEAWLEAERARGKVAPWGPTPVASVEAIRQMHHLASREGQPCAHCAAHDCVVDNHLLGSLGCMGLPYGPLGRREMERQPRVPPHRLTSEDDLVVSAMMAARVKNGGLVEPPDGATTSVDQPHFIHWKTEHAPPPGFSGGSPDEALAAVDRAVAPILEALHLPAALVGGMADLEMGEGGRPRSRSLAEEAREASGRRPPTPGRGGEGGPGAGEGLSARGLNQAWANAATSRKPRHVVDFKSSGTNSRLRSWAFSLIAIGMILAAVTPACFVASADLTAAFHVFTVPAADGPHLGVSWPESGSSSDPGPWRQFWLTRPTFGLSYMPALLSAFTGEMVTTLGRWAWRYMGSPLLHFFAYLDDIFVVGATRELCERGLADVKLYCDRVGYVLNDKLRDPRQVGIELLGLVLNTLTMTLALPVGKRYAMLLMVTLVLSLVVRGWRIPRNFVERLVGKLQSASYVVRGGRSRLWEFYQQLAAPGSSHTVDLGPARGVLVWWRDALADEARCGSRLLVTLVRPDGTEELTTGSDASGEVGGSVSLGGVTLWFIWDEAAKRLDIGTLEHYPPHYLIERFGWLFVGLLLKIETDNQGNVFAVNKAYTGDPDLVPYLRATLDTVAREDITLVSKHLIREHNQVHDALSKAVDETEVGRVLGGGWYQLA